MAHRTEEVTEKDGLLRPVRRGRRARRQAFLETFLPCCCLGALVVALFFTSGHEGIRSAARARAAALLAAVSSSGGAVAPKDSSSLPTPRLPDQEQTVLLAKPSVPIYLTGGAQEQPAAQISSAAKPGASSALAMNASASATSNQGGGSQTVSAARLQNHSTQAAVEATGFVPYFNYVGALAVAGSVGPMTTDGVTQSFHYSLTGVDPACVSGAGTSSNSCGIHIHSGNSCGADAGGHYYEGVVTSDPWSSVSYTSVNTAALGKLMVTTGGTGGDVIGRAMIIHAHDGSRIACATLTVTKGAARQVLLDLRSSVPPLHRQRL